MNWRRDPRLAYVLVNLCTLFWATNFALGRLLRDDIGPFTLTAAASPSPASFSPRCCCAAPPPSAYPAASGLSYSVWA